MAKTVIGDDNPDGSTLGKDTSALVSFYGVTAVAQASGSAMASISPTIATADSGVMFASAAGINALIAQVQELRTTVVNLGMHAGA